MSICRFVKRLKLVEEIQGKLFSQIYIPTQFPAQPPPKTQNKKEVNKLGSSRAVKRMGSEIISNPGTHFSGTTNTS
jgi:hypothetical protein